MASKWHLAILALVALPYANNMLGLFWLLADLFKVTVAMLPLLNTLSRLNLLPALFLPALFVTDS